MQNINIDLYPTKCHICGGSVILADNKFLYGKSFGSGKCYICTRCGAYARTNPEKPDEAIGVLTDKKIREVKKKCRPVFKSICSCGSNGQQAEDIKQAAYRKLAKMMQIPEEDCKFTYFDLLHMKKAYNCCKALKKKMHTYTWVYEDEVKKWLGVRRKHSGKRDAYDYVGSIRIATLCFDLIEREGEDGKLYLHANLYVGGKDDGYAKHGIDGYPYSYVDQIHGEWEIDKLPKYYKEFVQEMEKKITNLIRFAKAIPYKDTKYYLQEEIMGDLVMW